MVKADLVHRIEALYGGTTSERRGAGLCVYIYLYGFCMAQTPSVSEVTFSSPIGDVEILKSQQ